MLRLFSAALLVAAGFVTSAHASASPPSRARTLAAEPAPATYAETAPQPVDARCGDYRCDPPEDCHSCPGDCGSCCGNHHCEPPEDCRSCPQDCGGCH